jgi:hypothetical protein
MQTLNNDIDVRGFARPRPLRAIGASVERGGGGVRAVRKRISALPTLVAALTWIQERVAEERRRDFNAALSRLSMNEAGALVYAGSSGPGTLLTTTAFSHLLALVPGAPRGAAGYLLQIPPERRAQEVNALLQSAVTAGEDRELNLALRQVVKSDDDSSEHPVTFAVRSQRYALVGPREVAADLLAAAEMAPELAAARCEALYDGEVTSLKLFGESDKLSAELGKDETFGSVLSLLLDDRKARAIPVNLSVLRSTCLNLDLVCHDGKVDLARWRHVGDAKRIRGEVIETLREAHQLLPAWVGTYRTAATAALPEHHDRLDQLALLCGALPGQKKADARLQVPSVRPETVARVVAEAWETEGGESTQGALCNAVTRAAHEQPWPSIDCSRQLERQASLLRATPPPRFRAVIDAEFTKLAKDPSPATLN